MRFIGIDVHRDFCEIASHRAGITHLAWHMLTKHQDYIYERPALTFRKLCKLEMTAGSPARRNPGGRHGPGTVDNPAQWAREGVDALAIEADYVSSVQDRSAHRQR